MELNGVKIKYLSPIERVSLYKKHRDVLILHHIPKIGAGIPYIAEVETYLSKGTRWGIMISEDWDKIDNVILILRLFKEGFIRRYLIISTGKTRWDWDGRAFYSAPKVDLGLIPFKWI